MQNGATTATRVQTYNDTFHISALQAVIEYHIAHGTRLLTSTKMMTNGGFDLHGSPCQLLALRSPSSGKASVALDTFLDDAVVFLETTYQAHKGEAYLAKVRALLHKCVASPSFCAIMVRGIVKHIVHPDTD